MEFMYIIEGLTVIFSSYEDAENFRSWYNRKYWRADDSNSVEWIEPRQIKRFHYFESCKEATEWSIEPYGYME